MSHEKEPMQLGWAHLSVWPSRQSSHLLSPLPKRIGLPVAVGVLVSRASSSIIPRYRMQVEVTLLWYQHSLPLLALVDSDNLLDVDLASQADIQYESKVWTDFPMYLH